MKLFDRPYWNLAQAEIWVVFRDKGLVEDTEPPKNQRSSLLLLYPSMHSYQTMGSRSELLEALVSGTVKASGRSIKDPDEYREISTMEWSSLFLDPPNAYYRGSSNGKIEPWKDIRVESSVIKRRWPLVKKDTKHLQLHNWDQIRDIWKNLNKEKPYPGTQRGLIKEIQKQYEEKTSLKAPSRTQIQKYLKEWNLDGDTTEN